MTQGRTDIGDECDQLVFGGVHGREIQRGLSGMFDGSTHTSEQECAAGDGLHLFFAWGDDNVQHQSQIADPAPRP